MIKQEFVTQKYLADRLKTQKIEIIEEVNARMFEVMEGTMEIMRSYYDKKAERYMGAIIEGMKDDNRVIKDGMKMHAEKIDNHEIRLQGAGL